MENMKKNSRGVLFVVAVALVSLLLSKQVPYQLISAGVFALLLGMLLNPYIVRYNTVNSGIQFTAKKILKFAIILMGFSLSFSQVMEVGKYSLLVMTFTLITAFGGGYLFGKILKMNWKLSSLISAGTGICGGSAIAAIAPVIDAQDSDIAYSISATFIFDIIMVILFPLMGKYLGMTELGFGLWTGTAVNDTSSVVAAGYAFSDIAGNFSIIVKLTRTLSIVPIVVIFAYIDSRLARNKAAAGNSMSTVQMHNKINIASIFPWFIILFLIMVAVKSTGFVPDTVSQSISSASKFFMVMALAAIGLKTNFKKLAQSGMAPLTHGFIISSLVVIVSLLVQVFLGQV